ncbi:relaxase [Tannerella sp. oral taxon BU063 isolate Cell 8/11]|uniref:Relaxase n=1 Tax=Tannerella sp. oral taxon BU063 isolate Cell 8/11 TaxID=1411915 RepID=W2CW76_9BACT|nr:relaxase [Tannerella sp. oral taxon BU063 isolate Cell 8/11]
MIAKISSSNSLATTLGYNFKKVEKHEASVLLVQGLLQDRNGRYSRAQVLADMLRTIPARCRTKKTVFHCSLNPHPDEKLSDETLSRIAAEYMEALGYGVQPYIVFRHNDIPRAHIHIVSLRVDSEGRKINDRFERRRSKRITDALEAKFGLLPSRKKADVSAQPSAVEIGAGDIKRQVAAAVQYVLGRYAFQSVGEMNLLLARFRVTAEEVKTERKGRPFDGIVYAATDAEGHKICTPIKASEIGRRISYAALRRHFEQSKSVVRERAGAIRRAIADVMQTSPDRAEFIDRMRGHGIETVTRINTAGRLYGITFIDDTNGITVNGSRLGKGFAANVFNAYFAGEPNPFLEMSRPKEKEEQTAAVEELTESPNDMLPTEIDLSLQVHGADLRELAFQRRLRNRARVRLRRKPR